MNIVEFPETTAVIWVCDCGCSTFSLLGSGMIRCANCDVETDSEAGGWVREPDDEVREHDAGLVFGDVQGNGSVEFARRRITQMVSRDDVTAIVLVREDGRIQTWTRVETTEQMDWLTRRMKQAMKLLRSTVKAP